MQILMEEGSKGADVFIKKKDADASKFLRIVSGRDQKGLAMSNVTVIENTKGKSLKKAY